MAEYGGGRALCLSLIASTSDAARRAKLPALPIFPSLAPPLSSPMLLPNYQRHWPAYFDAVEGQPARDTLLRALKHLGPSSAPRLMIDLACGSGRDVLAALDHCQSWQIVATDTSSDGLARLQAKLATHGGAPASARGSQHVHALSRVALEAVALEGIPAWWAQSKRPAPMLINASFALPFGEPSEFPALWTWIRERLKPGGCFAGQLFGDRDDWAAIRKDSHFSREQVLQLLAGFEIVHLEEVEKDGSDAMGGTKHHHVFHIVAQKQ